MAAVFRFFNSAIGGCKGCRHARRGFTLAEVLIVVGVLVVLGAVVVMLISPGERLQEGRDSQRMTDLTAIDESIQALLFQNPAASLGTEGVVYVSLSDSTTTCANLGLPSLPTGYSYHCVSSENSRNADGTGWLPIDFTESEVATLLSLPIDPINATSTGLYYRYTPRYEIDAFLESGKYLSYGASDGGTNADTWERGPDISLLPDGLEGYVRIPGHAAYGTKDFYVMQFEAKYDKNGDGIGDNASAYSCTADSGNGWDWRDSGCSSGGSLVSTATGSPIVHLTHAQAVAACSATGAHVITNQEWMSIARNAEQIASNWSGGSVGSGCLFRGNNGTADACGYNGADIESGSGRDAKARLALSNGTIVYDLAGNAWEHVMRNASDMLTSHKNAPDAAGSSGVQWYTIQGSDGLGVNRTITSWDGFSYDEVGPQNTSWNATQGMGRVSVDSNNTVETLPELYMKRGGDWADGTNAGAFAMGLHMEASDQHADVGFRCAR